MFNQTALLEKLYESGDIFDSEGKNGLVQSVSFLGLF